MKKENLLLYFCIAIFGLLGIYLTFFSGNTNKFDSQVEAYRIYPNEKRDSDDEITYQPIYYFKVNGRDYECKVELGSSFYPKEDKNTVYYDSKDPTNCKTEYEKSTHTFAGIICLIATAIMVYFFIIRKPSNNIENNNQNDIEKPNQISQEKVEKIIGTVEKIQLIYKRIIIGIIIVILLFFVLIDTIIVKQTIVSKDYLETTAVFVKMNNIEDSSDFVDCIYTFTDKQENQQEIVVTISKNDEPKQEIKLKYNENNPQDYYEEGSTMDKSGIIWYIVKIVVLILLILLFFNKKILNKINISASK